MGKNADAEGKEKKQGICITKSKTQSSQAMVKLKQSSLLTFSLVLGTF